MKFFLWILVFFMVALQAEDTASTKKIVNAESYLASIHSKQIESKDLYKLMNDDKEKFLLIDIREQDQIAHGEIYHDDFLAITRGYLEFKIEKQVPDKNAKIVVYCSSGKRGNLAVKTLKDMGYTDVISLKGGITQWVNEGYPLFTVYGDVFIK